MRRRRPICITLFSSLVAVKHSREALRLRPNYIFTHDPVITSKNLHLVLAEGYYYLGDFIKATEEAIIVDSTVEIDPDNADLELLNVLEALTQRIDGK